MPDSHIFLITINTLQGEKAFDYGIYMHFDRMNHE